MADWGKISRNVERAAGKAVRKTEELADVALKNIKLATCDAKISKLFEKLGRLTYKQLKTGESQAEKISEIMLAIDRARAEYAELRREIEEDKKRREEAKRAEAAAKMNIEVVVPEERTEDN
jgi:hypothetical protein